MEDANRSLDYIRPLVAEIVSCKRELSRLMEEVGPLTTSLEAHVAEGDTRLDSTLNRLTRLAAELKRLLAELETTGVVLKDMDVGLVDFPAIIDGHPVYLCWRLDEEAVRFYHRVEDGFAGRKPL